MLDSQYGIDDMGAMTATVVAVHRLPVLTGVTLSFIMLVYTGRDADTSTFVVAAGMFGAMAAYGTVAKRSLAGWGQFLFMGLIGVVIASVVGIFWHNDGLQFVISVHRRHRLHGAGGLRRAAAEVDGADDAAEARPARTPSSAR